MGFLFHNWREFGFVALGALETATLPVAAFQLGLLVIVWRVHSLRSAAVLALAGLGLLHFVAGGILSVLPLAVLPFTPEQSLSHYTSHLVYAVSQLPLLRLVVKGLLTREPEKT